MVNRLGAAAPSHCGRSSTLLSEQGGAVDIATVAECWRAAGGGPARLSETLHANRHLLNIEAERVELRLSLPAVHETQSRRRWASTVAAAINAR